MLDHIAVILNEKNELSSIENCCTVIVYHHRENNWKSVEEIQWQAGALTGADHIRSKIHILAEQLGNCRVIAGKKINGLPYQIFDRKGFHIFETQSAVSSELFDSIREDLAESLKKAKEAAKKQASIPTTPHSPESNGIYYLNLIELQDAFPEISSKKALKSFIETTDFTELRLICRHLPPWLEADARRRNMRIQLQHQSSESCNVIISAREDEKCDFTR